ncbi:GNAT family N-acetyltransferase [Brevundimonas sp. VNH65]|uniref:GNAT family N-acetyltransferase n=1 Tax=Brevundimonas sp. VNH65 TaxID=3400917 RepID=UPI003C0C7D6F
MTPADLDGVVEVARVAFPDHFEDQTCFANRLNLHPAGCFSLAEPDGPVMGYLVGYPWRGTAAPALNTLIDGLPSHPDRLYLHDLALKPEARGGGRTRAAVEALADHARALGLPLMALVAVNDAVRFWEGQGFAVVDAPDIRAKLAGYGPDARYMERSL